MSNLNENDYTQPVLEWTVVTPELARQIIETDKAHHINRPITNPHVSRMVKDMKSGNWIVNTTPIKFDKENHLFDGQHRLRAVMESGVSLPFLFARNCDLAEFNVQDIGLRRALADIEYIRIGGVVAHRTMKERMAVSNRMMRGISSTYGRCSDMDRQRFYHQHEDTVCWAVETGGPKRYGIPHSTVVLAIAARAAYSWDRHDLERFIHQFREGNVDSPDSPVRRLRDYYLQTEMGGNSAVMRMYYKTQSALQAFLQKREIKSIKAIEKELFLLPEEASHLAA